MSRFKRVVIEATFAVAIAGCMFFAARGNTPPADAPQKQKQTVVLLVAIVKDGKPIKLYSYLRKEWDSVAACEAEVRDDPAYQEAFKRLADSVAPEVGPEFNVRGQCVVKPATTGAPI